MDWLVGEQVCIHPFGKGADEAILTGSIVQANKTGFLFISSHGEMTQMSWATIVGYQVTKVIDQELMKQVSADASKAIQS